MDRDQKNTDCDEELTMDRQACSSSEHHPSSSSASQLPAPDGDGESSDHELSDYDPFDNDDEYIVIRRMHKAVLGLAADGLGESAQLATLTELCEVLSVMEDAAEDYHLELFVQPIVKLAAKDGNPEIMILAVRALTYLCDVWPSTSVEIVRHGTIPVLCRKLLAIEYLDVAEQVGGSYSSSYIQLHYYV